LVSISPARSAKSVQWQHAVHFVIVIGERRTRGSMQCISPLLLAKQSAGTTFHALGSVYFAITNGEILLPVRKVNWTYKLQMVVTFDRNVRLRPIICQNVRNWKRNPLTIVERNLVNWFFQKTPLSRWKIGFKIQSPDFSKSFKFCYSIIMEKSGDWILNPIFHLFRGVFGKISWPNPLWEFLEDSFFNFEHFDILWASNGHFY